MPEGVTVTIGHELASALGTPVSFECFPNSGQLTDALEQRLVDVAFMPVDEERSRRVAFGPAYFVIESTALVRGESSFVRVADLNVPGVKVAGIANTTTIRSAARVLPAAEMVPIAAVSDALQALVDGHVNALVLSRDVLLSYQRRIPGSRLLEDRLHATGIAVAVARGTPAALEFVSAFMEYEKANGAVRRAFDLFGFHGEPVAPAEFANGSKNGTDRA